MSARPELVLEMVQQNDDKQEAAHKRLRTDFDRMEAMLEAIELAHTDLRTRVTVLDGRVANYETAPIAVQRLNFGPQMVVGIAIAVVTIALSSLLPMQNISNRMDAAQELTKSHQKLEDERHEAAVKAAEQEGKHFQMIQLWMNDVDKKLSTSRR